MCQFEAPKQEGKSDEARVRMRQEAQEAYAGEFCKRKSNGRGEGSGGCGREQAEERGAMKNHENEVAGPGNRQT